MADEVLEPLTLHRARHAGTLAGDALQRAGEHFQRVAHQLDGCFNRLDMLLSPVVSDEPPPLGWLGP